MHKKKLPIGIENFEDIIKEDFYYVDKTGSISELMMNWGAMNLFTRPRRFGKSLNMSMLENYWMNTSSNDAVKRFISESANAATKREVERLISGEVIVKKIFWMTA